MTFDGVYRQVLRLWGRDPDNWSANAKEQEEVADAMTFWARIAWEEVFWSMLTRTEEREVTEDANGARYVPWAASGLATIAAVHSVWSKNPLLGKGGRNLSYSLSARGVEIPDIPYTSVWLNFRTEPIAFTRVEYAGGTTYAVGDVVYDDASKECYRSLQGANVGHAVSDAEWWEPMLIPDFLREVIRRGGFAELLRNDGQGDRADVEEARAQGELDRAVDAEEDAQGQVRQINVKV